jgi:tetratricopeptide (TPR) repeat protein
VSWYSQICAANTAPTQASGSLLNEMKSAHCLRIAWLVFIWMGFESRPFLAWAQSTDVLADLYKEARQAQLAGDLKTATEKYKRIVSLRPDMAEAHANLGVLFYQQKQSEPALKAFKRAIQLKPDLAGPYFFLGVLSFNARNYTEASQYLEKAETQDPSNFAIQLYSGFNDYARANYLDATRHFEKAVSIDGSDLDAAYHLSKSYGHLSRRYFEGLHKTHPNSFQTDLARAHFYEAQQNWEAAKEEYSHALEKRPDSGRLRQRLDWVTQKASGASVAPLEGNTESDAIDGSIAFFYAPPSGARIREELQRYQKRVQTAQNQNDSSADTLYALAEGYHMLSYLVSLWIFETEPNSYHSHQLKGQYFEALNKDDQAIQEYRRALAIKPDLQNVHFAIGNLLWTQSRSEEALLELQEEIKLDPNHPQAHYEIGDIFYGQGKLAEAETHLLKAVKLEPSMIEAHLALERLYTSQEQVTKALYHLAKAVEIDPEDATPHYRLSVLYRKLGRIPEADKEVRLFEKYKTREKTKLKP